MLPPSLTGWCLQERQPAEVAAAGARSLGGGSVDGESPSSSGHLAQLQAQLAAVVPELEGLRATVPELERLRALVPELEAEVSQQAEALRAKVKELVAKGVEVADLNARMQVRGCLLGWATRSA